jgi:hypothetical protein
MIRFKILQFFLDQQATALDGNGSGKEHKQVVKLRCIRLWTSVRNEMIVFCYSIYSTFREMEKVQAKNSNSIG